MPPALQRLVGGAPLLGPGAPPSPTVVQAAEARWRELAAQPDGLPVDRVAAWAAPAGLRRQQRVLSLAMDRERCREGLPPHYLR